MDVVYYILCMLIGAFRHLGLCYRSILISEVNFSLYLFIYGTVLTTVSPCESSTTTFINIGNMCSLLHMKFCVY